MSKLMTDEEFDFHKSVARIRVSQFDEIDGGDRSIESIIAAVECGLKLPDSGAGFDALVMLEDVAAAVRKRPSD